MTVIALTASGPEPSVVISNDAFSREGEAISDTGLRQAGKTDLGSAAFGAWLQKIDDWIDANVPKFVELVAIVVTAAVAIIALFLRR